MGGQARGLVMSVLQNDPASKALIWADVYASVQGEGQQYHIEFDKGNEAIYLIHAHLASHAEKVDLNMALQNSIDVPIERCIAKTICNRYGVQACSIIPAYGQVDVEGIEYYTAHIPVSYRGAAPSQLLIICERKTNGH